MIFTNKKALLTTVPSDSHTWNLVFMQLFLEEKGFEVLNLGACTPFALVIEKIHAFRPHMLVVSTINGHGYIDGISLMENVRKHDLLKNITVVIGGKLGIHSGNSHSTAIMDSLKQNGFDGVFEGDNALVSFTKFLKNVTFDTYTKVTA